MAPIIPMMIMLTTALSPTSPFAESVKRIEVDFFAWARTKLAMQLLQHSSKSSVSEKKWDEKMRRWEINEFSVKPEIRKFPRYSKFAVNQMHQVRVIMSPVIIVMILMFDTVLVIVMSSPSSNMWKQRDKNDWKGWRRPKGFLDRDWSQSKIQSDLRSGFL